MARIAILTLTEQRDKAVDERIAQWLRDKGHEVLVRHFALAGQECVCYERPEVVVVPMVGSLQKLDLVKHCHAWGLTVVVRRGEAGAARDVLASLDPERQKVIVGDYDYAPYVDLELTWGREFTDVLVERGRIPKDKVVPCGAFTLDGCFNKPKARNVGKKVLLFATAWSAADDDPAYTECGVAADSPLQGQLYTIHRRGRDEWIRAIKNLHLTKGHKYDFLLKVRPGERTAEYIEKLGSFVRVLPYDFPSADAIAMSDCVIHAGSTMAIEAHLLGVPSINYCNANPDPRLAAVVPMCDDFSQLTEALGRLHWGHSNIDPASYDWLGGHLYGHVDGHACDRAAAAIHKAANARGKKATLTTPAAWPHELLYPSDQTNLTGGKGYIRIMCVG